MDRRADCLEQLLHPIPGPVDPGFRLGWDPGPGTPKDVSNKEYWMQEPPIAFCCLSRWAAWMQRCCSQASGVATDTHDQAHGAFPAACRAYLPRDRQFPNSSHLCAVRLAASRSQSGRPKPAGMTTVLPHRVLLDLIGGASPHRLGRRSGLIGQRVCPGSLRVVQRELSLGFTLTQHHRPQNDHHPGGIRSPSGHRPVPLHLIAVPSDP